MLQYQGQKVLKHKFYSSSGQQIIKTYRFTSDIQKREAYSLHNVVDIQTNIHHTLKIIFKNNLLQKDKIVTEIKNMKIFCEKQNFINLYDVYEDQNSIFMIMEQWGITLAEVIRRRSVLSEYEVQIIFSQLVNILSDLRSNNISHGNICLQSIYVDLKKNNLIKLGVFSKSFDLKYYFQEVVNIANSQQLQKTVNQYKTQLSTQTSTISHLKRQKEQLLTVYTSPQKLKLSSILNNQNQYLKVQQFYQNDVWSLGIIIFRLLIGRYPFVLNENFDEDDWIELPQPKFQMINQCLFNFNNPFLRGGQNGQHTRSLNQNISLQFKQLIKSILTFKNKRIKLKDLINHPLKLNSYHNLSQKCQANFNSFYCPLKALNSYHLQKNIKAVNSAVDIILSQTNQSKQKTKYLSSATNNSHFSLYSQQTQNFQFKSGKKRNFTFNNQKYNSMWDLNFQRKNMQFELNKQSNQNQKLIQSKAFNQMFQPNLCKYSKSTLQKKQTSSKQKDVQFIFEQSQQDFSNQQFPLIQQCSNDNDITALKKSSHFKGQNSQKTKQNQKQNRNIKKYNNSIVVKPNRFTIRNIKDRKNIINCRILAKNMVQSVGSNGSANFKVLSTNSEPFNNPQSGSSSTKFNSFSDGFQYSSKLNGYSNSNINSNKYPQLSKLNNKYTIIQIQKQFSDQQSVQQESLQYQTIRIQKMLISNRLSDIPLIIQQPSYVFKYKYKKQYDSFGYVLNHGIGVIFNDGQHVIGHHQNDYKYIENNNKVLPTSKMNVFKYYLNYFGKRVIYGTLSLWIQKYWRDGKVFVFLMSNGCWQVSFQHKKTCRFYIIDQNDLSWNKQNAPVDVMNIVRTIVNSKKQFYLNQQRCFQNQL